MAIRIYQGAVYDCYLSETAANEIGFSEADEDLPESICGEESNEIISRIIMYCDGECLEIPFELNQEGHVFWAIKTARPQSLRAYFWHEGKDMIITHFIKKDTPQLTPQNKTKMHQIRDDYNRNGY